MKNTITNYSVYDVRDTIRIYFVVRNLKLTTRRMQGILRGEIKSLEDLFHAKAGALARAYRGESPWGLTPAARREFERGVVDLFD